MGVINDGVGVSLGAGISLLMNGSYGVSKNGVSIGTWRYTFDGIDDYVTVPTVELLTGDVVEFTARITTGDGWAPYIEGPSATTRSRIRIDATTNVWSIFGGTLHIDGVLVTSGEVANRTGDISEFRYEATSTRTLSLIGTDAGIGIFFNDVISNLRVTRLNPTALHPNLFYPIDDGWENNPTIRQTLPTDTDLDGTASNFNESEWGLV